MHEEFKYLRNRVDGIADTLARNTTILEANTESLKEHMRRTELLEAQVDRAIIPYNVMKWTAYILGLLGTIGGGILGIRQLLGK